MFWQKHFGRLCKRRPEVPDALNLRTQKPAISGRLHIAWLAGLARPTPAVPN
jgi:hypothetical protein